MWEFSAPKSDRLDRLLRGQQVSPWLSRQAWEQLIAEGKVRVGGHFIRKAGEQVPAGAKVEVDLPALGLQPAEDFSAPLWISPDGALAVFSKAAGVNTYPLLPWESGTLANQIAGYLESQGELKAEEYAALGEPPVLEGGLLQRLDKDTSGLVATAFTKEAKLKFRKVFSGDVEKAYLAIVGGDASRISGRRRLFFAVSEAPRVAAYLEERGGAKEVCLDLKVLDKSDSASLVEVATSQGLRHVVRAGLAALGHPLVGDALYAGEPVAPFHQLHAYSLKIPGFDRLLSGPPQSFLDCLQKLGLHSSL